MKLSKIIYIAACGIALASCQGMDLTPPDKYSEKDFWKTPEDYCLAANEFYWNLDSFHGSDNFADYDLKADLATSYFGFNTVSNGRWLPTESDGIWDNAYSHLRQINILLQHVDAMKTDDPAILRYKGEALFFRAYEYYRLLKRFGDVPLVKTVLDVNSPELFGERTPRKEVEDAILEDLKEACEYLPTKKELKPEETGRITLGAAKAFRARVALFVGTWAQNHKHRPDALELLGIAKREAKEIIDSKDYDLWKGEKYGKENYRQLFLEAGDNSCESILDRQYGKGVGNGTTHPISDNASAGYLGGATKKFADMFLDKNGLPITNINSCFHGYGSIESEYEDRDPRMTCVLQVPGRQYIYASTNGKYETCPVSFSGTSSTKTGYRVWKYISDVPYIFHGLAYFNAHLIRYAEVLLIYAEATYELSGSISDEDLDMTINKIRARVGMPRLTNSFVTSNGLDMREEIRRERTIELCFESSRYDDLRRWKTAEVEMPMPLKGVKFSNYADANETLDPILDENGFVIAEQDRRFRPTRDYLAPIPTKQINMTNGAIKQNPGW